MNQAAARDDWIDALRVLALFGVFIVNGMGYPSLFNQEMPAGAPNPLDSLLAQALHGLQVALLENKAYPLLCFLFGHSAYGLYMRATNVTALRVRYWKLLLIGVLPGMGLYGGDILTVYAITGLCAAPWLARKLNKLLNTLRILRNCFVCIILVLLVLTSIAMWKLVPMSIPLAEVSLSAVAPQSLASLYANNTRFYLEGNVYSLVTLPLFLYLFTAGAVCARLRLLSTHRIAKAYWAKHWGQWHLWLALSANAALGLLSVWLHLKHPPYASLVLPFLIMPLGIYLAIALLAATMRYRLRCAAQQAPTPAWVRGLAPAGRHTLVMYLALSCGLLLSSGAFFALGGTTAQRTLAFAIAWFLAMRLALYASRQQPPLKDPLTRWLSRPLATKQMMVQERPTI